MNFVTVLSYSLLYERSIIKINKIGNTKVFVYKMFPVSVVCVT